MFPKFRDTLTAFQNRKRDKKTKEDFEVIRQQISIEIVANYLLQKQGKNYIFPGERTGSIKLYPESGTFYDFGRAAGGDVVRLWSHIQGCDSWTALQQIRETFGLNTPDKQYSRDAIRQQELARKYQLEAQKEAKRQWAKEMDMLKAECELYRAILDSGHCKPLSWTWCTCKNHLTVAEGKMDILCGM